MLAAVLVLKIWWIKGSESLSHGNASSTDLALFLLHTSSQTSDLLLNKVFDLMFCSPWNRQNDSEAPPALPKLCPRGIRTLQTRPNRNWRVLIGTVSSESTKPRPKSARELQKTRKAAKNETRKVTTDETKTKRYQMILNHS